MTFGSPVVVQSNLDRSIGRSNSPDLTTPFKKNIKNDVVKSEPSDWKAQIQLHPLQSSIQL